MLFLSRVVFYIRIIESEDILEIDKNEFDDISLSTV